MTRAILDFAAQCREARRIGQTAQPPGEFGGAANMVILGMGGSAIGGDLFRALFENELRIPVVINRDYNIPRFVDSHTLVVASSYSGNTEETLSGYQQARERGAMVMAFCTGGKLKEQAHSDGYPVVTIPGGLSPRAALGYSFLPLMTVAENLGFISDKSQDFAEMVERAEQLRDRLGPDVPAEKSFAKQLAQACFGKLPIIYGAGGWRSVVAARWKGQFNENAKNIAYWNAFPELNHNETVGWEAPASVNRQTHVIILRDTEETVRFGRRVDVTREIMQPAVGGFTEVRAEGRSPLARLFSLVYTGDFVSLYLSILNGIDPTPVRVIDRLKGELSKLG